MNTQVKESKNTSYSHGNMHRKTWFLLTQHMYLDLLTTICLILLLGYYSVHDVHVLLSNLNLGSIVLLCIVDQFYRYFIPVKTISFTLYLTSYNPPSTFLPLSPVRAGKGGGDAGGHHRLLQCPGGVQGGRPGHPHGQPGGCLAQSP